MTATTISHNPFDDSYDDNDAVTNNVSRSINPFDDAGGGDPDASTSTSVHNNSFQQDDSLVVDGGADDRNAHNFTAAPEASWQYLGELPYRRVPIYSNVQWHPPPPTHDQHHRDDDDVYHHGLASYPPAALKRHPKLIDRREVGLLLSKTTKTLIAGCPHGGPLASITLPLVTSESFAQAELRIVTNAGQLLSSWNFPPLESSNISGSGTGTAAATAAATAAGGAGRRDVVTMGFTSRTCLVLVLKDSTCFTYNLRGEHVLAPFVLLSHGHVQTAHVYTGGVAVLAQHQQVVLCELLDGHDHDDDGGDYLQTAHITSRQIFGPDNHHYALLTTLPTDDFAQRHFLSYLTLAVLPRERTAHRHPEVFLSTTDCSVVVINASTAVAVDVDCRPRLSSPILDMCFAPNGRFLACFTQASMLTVISTSFETKVLDFDTSDGSSAPPLNMVWCGEDSVVLHWKNLGVLMVGPYGDWIRLMYASTDHVFLIPEVDCCRVVTDSSVEILQRVPPVTAQLLRIGSIEPAAMLLDAADAFVAGGSAASDEAARSIVETGQLVEAIETCVEAAVREFDIATQKRLLGAASFGMHFAYKNGHDSDQTLLMGGPASGSELMSGILPSFTTAKFVEAARKLRIMNALRNPNVGVIVTSAQFDAVTATGIVGRLIAMKRPALASSICQYLSLPRSVQLYARASKAAALVERDDKKHTDSEIAEAAIAIVENRGVEDTSSKRAATWTPAASSSLNRGAYATVALAANRAGRPGVANLLLMLESSVADKVPALISTGSYADAVAVATTARASDFIFTTVMDFERSCIESAPAGDMSKAQASFLNTVVSKFTPEAFHILRSYRATMPDVKSVTALLLRAQKYADAGAVQAKRAMKQKDFREKQGMLSEAARIFAMGKDTAFDKSCTDDYLELLKDQEVLRTKYGANEVARESSSVAATITSVLFYAATNVREQHRLLADADKLGKKFRVSEKRLWYIKVRAFAESEQWSNLRILADSRAKPPIGFKPFARAVIKGRQGNPEIMRYIDRIASPEEKYDLFCEASLWKKALDEAVKIRDDRRILNVKSLCNSSEIQLLADQALGRIA